MAQLPLYQQIFLVLQNKIMEREYREGEFLPGERELERLFGVSRITAVRALNELALRGFAVREQGRGTRVQFVDQGTVARGPTELPAIDSSTMVGTVGDFVNVMNGRKLRDVEVFRFHYAAALPGVASALGIGTGDVVQHAERVWRLEGRPFSHITTYVPADIGEAWTGDDLTRTPLTVLMAKSGVVIARIEERITAILADHVLSDRLEVEVGTPLIKIFRTSFNKDDRAVEYVIGAYAPDRYQYAVSITRDGTSVSGPPLGLRKTRR